jgi:hypothetical protein
VKSKRGDLSARRIRTERSPSTLKTLIFATRILSQSRKNVGSPPEPVSSGLKSVRENFQAFLRDALRFPLYPALKAPGYSQTPLRRANPARLSHSAD